MTNTVHTIKAADLQGIGVSKPYAHQLVSGRRSPSLKLALKIQERLGVPVKSWPMARKAQPVPAPDKQDRAA